MTDCLYCDDGRVRKNGRLASGGQRWKCTDCNKQFSTGGARDTYSPGYKEMVAKEYCHTPAKAQEILDKYGISSKTLIDWKKKHVEDCDVCCG